MARGEVRYRLNLDTSGFDAGAKKALATMAALVGGWKLITDSLKAQADQEAAINKLNLALANQGRLTKETTDALLGQASALQAVTTYGDDAITGAQAIFASFGMNQAQIERTTKATLDFAAATGTDLTAAANLMGKAFVGETGTLSRYGIVVDKSLSDTKKFEAAVGQLEQRFGGSAQAATATFTGQMKQLRNGFGDVQEGLGKLLGVIANFGSGTGSLISFAERAAKFFGTDLVIAIGEVRAQLLLFLASMSDAVAWLQKIQENNPLALPSQRQAAGEQRRFYEETAKGLRQQAVAVREESDASAAAAGNLLKFMNAAAGAAGASDDGAAAAKRYEAALKRLGEQAGELTKNEVKALGQVFKDRDAAAAGVGFMQFPGLGEPASAAIVQVDRLQMEIALARQAWIDAGKDPNGFDKVITKAADEGFNLGATLKRLPGLIVGAFQGGGDVGKTIGSAIFGDIGAKLGESLTKAMAGVGGVLGKALGSLGSALGPLGSILGGSLGSIFGKLFGNEHKKVNDMRDAFIAAAGGITELDKRAQAAGLTVDRLLNAKKVKEYEAAVKELGDAFALQDQAQQALADAIERYGFSIDQLGPKFKQQKLDEMAAQLIQDYKLLTASGIENDTVIKQMAASYNAYVQTAIASGAAIPEAMRPVLQRMIDLGLLVDADGKAFENLEAVGVTFTDSMTNQFKTLLEKIDDLVSALLGIPNVRRTVTVNTVYNGGDQGDGSGDDDDGGRRRNNRGAASGFSGLISGPVTGYPAPFTMHGTEHVQITPAGGVAGGGHELLEELRTMNRNFANLPRLIARSVRAAAQGAS